MLDCVTEIPLAGRVLTPLGGAAREPLPSFVAGPENQLVAGAVGELLAAAREHGAACGSKRFLPSVLVLFGTSGTGKSHLAHGLVRHWQSQRDDSSAIYITAPDFRHLLHDAIKRQTELQFRAEFRTRQLLAIDDLQFLPPDDFAWQELRYTLDDYEDRGATVIVTASESVATLSNVPVDIRSRLACGLSLQIAPPGTEARVRVIRNAATALSRPISDQAIKRLAQRVDDNIHSLFQAVFALCAPAQNDQAEVPTNAEQGVGAGGRPTVREVLAIVARFHNLPQARLKSSSRRQSIVSARGIAVWLARELAGASYDEIGRVLGGRDHTTIIHNYRKIDALYKRDAQTQKTIEYLRRILLSR